MTLTLYSRPGCHLCEEMKAVVEAVTGRLPGRIALDEVDISGDQDLEARFGMEIPVLFIDDAKVAKCRITEGELSRALHARLVPGLTQVPLSRSNP